MFDDPEKLFIKYIQVIEDFATKHNVLLEKFRHNATSCNLTYRRKDKGYCNIQILISEDDKISIFGLWEYINREELKKYTANISKINRNINPDLLNNELKDFFIKLNRMSEKDIQEVKDIGYELKTYTGKNLDDFFDGINYPVCKP